MPEPKDSFSSYCFEKDLKITHLAGSTSTGSIDLFKEGCLVLEAKQGSTKAKPGSTPVRGTRTYDQYMEKAFGQAGTPITEIQSMLGHKCITTTMIYIETGQEAKRKAQDALSERLGLG